jgi:hypothetical protein
VNAKHAVLVNTKTNPHKAHAKHAVLVNTKTNPDKVNANHVMLVITKTNPDKVNANDVVLVNTVLVVPSASLRKSLRRRTLHSLHSLVEAVSFS